jgi:hypothetical protein
MVDKAFTECYESITGVLTADEPIYFDGIELPYPKDEFGAYKVAHRAAHVKTVNSTPLENTSGSRAVPFIDVSDNSGILIGVLTSNIHPREFAKTGSREPGNGVEIALVEGGGKFLVEASDQGITIGQYVYVDESTTSSASSGTFYSSATLVLAGTRFPIGYALSSATAGKLAQVLFSPVGRF